MTGPSEQVHLSTLGEVFQILLEHGVHTKRGKCKFLAESIEYLGHHIDEKGFMLSIKSYVLLSKPLLLKMFKN